ncbi:MAG: hypothetical protein HUJ22_07475 [Gracilimonas sp.]|uniref:hypothetical protein n=1 Tax=Gracilimonas sp. TaxID=1974203 RepID=UPI0019AD65C1|nr:hypothetical protein [Gracilimonas sp.]MBD3616397.1 hypothetical protein [Gracilimonas sp.]
MKSLSAYSLSLLLSISFLISGCQEKKSQESAEEQSTNELTIEPEAYFDFWLGRWEVSWEEANGATGRGTNFIEKTLDGKVIRENFRVNEGQMKGFMGTSISVYNPRTNIWKQAWADNQGGYFNFTGKIDGTNRIFQTDVQERGADTLFTQRMLFYDITSDSLKWDWESSFDGGKNWNLNWRIFYRKVD